MPRSIDCHTGMAQCSTMNIDRFWNIIESASSSAADSGLLFDQALVGLLAGCPQADMGEDFDFDDADEMRRRLPRLARLHLGADD